ncbi:MAG: DUF3575 domain-containing protein [Myxococcales bacterium]|nr:DUF3575 domain-containing protein [Myxococcales bacterium]
MRLLPPLALCLAATAAQAAPKHTIQVDPLTTALGFVHLQFERALTDRVSIYVGPHLRLFNSLLSDDDEPYKGYGAELGVRLFFRPTAPEGPWVQMRGVAAHLTLDDGDDTAFGGYVSGLGGWTWIFDEQWVLAAGLGVQYLHYAIGDLGPKGVFPAMHTTIGYAF